MILTSIVLGIVASVLAVELLGVTRWLAHKIIVRAVEFLPETEKERWQEEWLTELEKLHRFGLFLPQLWFAFNTYFGAPKLGMVLRNGLDFDDKFGFFKFVQYLFAFNVLRVLESLTVFIISRTKDETKRKEALEFFLKVCSTKVWIGCLVAPLWFKRYSDKLTETWNSFKHNRQSIDKTLLIQCLSLMLVEIPISSQEPKSK